MDIFIEISLIITLAAVISGIMRLLKQPIIIGYILTGLVVGPSVLGFIQNTQTIAIFSEMGIAILLFIVGLNLSPNQVKEVGGVSFIVGTGQILITAVLGFIVSKLLGFSNIESLYLATALTFSSTIIVLKLLSDKREIETLYGRISIGILLIQDVVATIALIAVSTFSNGNNPIFSAAFLILKGLALTALLTIVSIYILPRLSAFFAKSQEFLFLFSIGWGFGMAALFNYLGFSIETGALIAGVTLSVSPYSQDISSRLKPLRDFFVIMFFILLGSRLALSNLAQLFIPIAALSLFSFFIKPLIILFLMSFSGYNKKTSFSTAFALSQISEFSLILILLGVNTGHLSEELLSIIIFVGLITIAGSTYFFMFSEKIYARISKYISFLERKEPVSESDILSSHEVILFGCNRVGYDFLRVFKKLGPGFLVVDFDPEVISDLTAMNINCRYGDADDPEFLEELNLGGSKMVISTIPDFETNSFILSKVRQKSSSVIVILISYSIDDTLKLYEAGATYVIMPHFIGGKFAADLAGESGFNINKFLDERNAHIEHLKERKALGHVHPSKN